ncbi:hypothetical protein RJ55_01995 [Drechmeria coniospora]|nr:hypothetical protein RJ55_01995 [Drechmeria coniospora]
MLDSLLRDAPRTFTRLVGRPPAGLQVGGRRALASAKKLTTPSMLAVASDVARQLDETGVWRRRRGRQKADALRVVEPRRVNIVSEPLCDDIIKYIGTSLERHRGCDLVDLNPGAGVWSRKLHDFLEPRRHVMMDLDADLYRPFLTDLLAKNDKVHLIAKSGIIWKDLLEMIRTQLSGQEEMHKDSHNRNDTLLVTANLSTFPKKAYNGFDSISTMVMYQLMSSIRTSSLFQRYGLVRMLVWVNDEDKRRLLPRSINRRRRSAFEAELSCDWIHEVAGLDAEVEDRYALRDEWINKESAYNTLERMAARGLTMPNGRETLAYTNAAAEPSLMGKKLAGLHPPTLSRPFKQELEDLEQALGRAKSASAPSRLKALRQREKYDREDGLTYLDLLQEHEAISTSGMNRGSSTSDFATADAAWNDRIDNLKKNARNEFNTIRDGYHLFRQDPPALLWDRRAYEPLSIRADEFFPNAPTALLDIQPKAMHALFRQHGPSSTRSGDMSEVMLRYWFHNTLLPVRRAMEGLWAGFGDLIENCPSVRDHGRGGTPMTGHGALTARSLNEAQWAEIMQAWMDWPFRPTYSQMLGRLVEDVDADADADDDVKSSAGGLAF